MHTLTFEEVSRLDAVLADIIQIHGRGNFPTIEVQPKKFIKLLIAKLTESNISIADYRVNGGAASHVLNLKQDEDNQDNSYNDLDLIFNVSIPSDSCFTQIKDCVLNTLMEFFPGEVSKERISSLTMKEAYVKKMVKVVNKQDTWSLISLTNQEGCDIELKFVDTMKRKFQFSVDSFQIILDSLIKFYDLPSDITMSETLFPTVLAESVYGDFEEARYHLSNKLIATISPEEIRGGGLLKYCYLLCCGFQPASDGITSMEKYMCSRFFIDFKDILVQQHTLDGYLNSHCSLENRYKYLTILHSVVENSTVCLMGHERRQTLRMIQDMCNQMIHQTNYHQPITVYYPVPSYVQHSSYNIPHQRHYNMRQMASVNEFFVVNGRQWKNTSSRHSKSLQSC
ncbi:terminal nucleotidyltransferase 5A-like [Clytia hemisphaerica]|uniref:terminal nucleotidyltransferase 5A-like n=1 Tax=Clytia hemisphaerica TaxID=252671 RepID=UPI0034D465A2|eukprot:TCONS_00018409-protein